MNKLKLILSVSLLAITVNSAFAQTRSSLPSSWKSETKPQVKQSQPTTQIATNVNANQKLPKGVVVLPSSFMSSCEGKKQGNSCEFQMDNNKIKGVCGAISTSKILGCKSSDPVAVLPDSVKPKLTDANGIPTKFDKEKSQSKVVFIENKLPIAPFVPPKEMIDSCSNKLIGNNCSVSSSEFKYKGFCSQTPYSKNLICSPKNAPEKDEKGMFSPPTDFPPFKACEGKPAGKSCSMNMGGKNMEGVCFKPSPEKKMSCMPNNHHKANTK